MAHGSCQKQVLLVPKAIFSLVAINARSIVLLKVIRLIKLIKYYLEVSVRRMTHQLTPPFWCPIPHETTPTRLHTRIGHPKGAHCCTKWPKSAPCSIRKEGVKAGTYRYVPPVPTQPDPSAPKYRKATNLTPHLHSGYSTTTPNNHTQAIVSSHHTHVVRSHGYGRLPMA